MDTFLGLTGTVWTGLTALATLGLVFYAARQLHSAAQDSREKARPVIVPRLAINRWGTRADLIVRNYGPSAAFDVNVELPSDLVDRASGMPATTDYLTFLTKKYGQSVPVWAPGQEERDTYTLGQEAPNPKEEALPPLSVTISYSGADYQPRWWQFKRKGKPQFSDTYELSLHHLIWTLVPSSSRDLDKQMQALTKSVDKLVQAQQRTAAALAGTQES